MASMTAAQWAKKIWNDEGVSSVDDAPEAMRGEVADALAAMREKNAATVAAFSAPFDRQTVGGAIYRTVAEADAVRAILADAGLTGACPSSPAATRALADAGRWGRYLDAIEGRVIDMGSLDPIDIGFDVRVQRMHVRVPDAGEREVVRVVMPRSRRHQRGEVLYGSPAQIRTALNERGFLTA